MKEWHLENMKKTIIKYVTGLLDTATLYQRKQHKKYSGNLSKVHKSITFDIRQGVTTMEVLDFLEKVRYGRELPLCHTSSDLRYFFKDIWFLFVFANYL